MRALKWHEQKLLKKVDLLAWKSSRGGSGGSGSTRSNTREAAVLRRYHITSRDDYKKYNKLSGMVRKLSFHLRRLPADDSERKSMQSALLSRLHDMGLLAPSNNNKSLKSCEELATSAFCRRRLATVRNNPAAENDHFNIQTQMERKRMILIF